MTAEQFFHNWCKKKGYVAIDQADDIEECFIEFAQHHVTEALKAASEQVQLTGFSSEFLQEGASNAIDKQTIIDSYPLNKII